MSKILKASLNASLGLKVSLGLAMTTLAAATAQAGCPVYKPAPPCIKCTGPVTGKSTLPPLSSYFEHQARCGHSTNQSPTMSASSASASTYANASTTGPTASASASATASSGLVGSSQASAFARATGTGSSASAYANISQVPMITSTYRQSDYSYRAFAGQFGGLGPNEQLQPTQCPVAVHNPEGRRVLGCYHVVKRWTPPKVRRPIDNGTYYRVVRPIIYVRYPVPVPVCVSGQCAPQSYSRYGF